MKTQEYSVGAAIEDALHFDVDRHLLSGVDLWPRVRDAIQQRDIHPTRATSARRRWNWSLVCGIMAAGLIGLEGFGGVVAAPLARTVRSTLQSVGIVVGPGPVVDRVTPALPFPLSNPTYVPAGLTHFDFSYLPGPPLGWTSSISNVPASPADRTEITALERAGTVGVLLHYTALPPSSGFMDIVEQSPSDGALLAGSETTTVNGAPAIVAQQGAETTVQIRRPTVLLTIRTDLSRADALHVARSISP